MEPNKDGKPFLLEFRSSKWLIAVTVYCATFTVSHQMHPSGLADQISQDGFIYGIVRYSPTTRCELQAEDSSRLSQ